MHARRDIIRAAKFIGLDFSSSRALTIGLALQREKKAEIYTTAITITIAHIIARTRALTPDSTVAKKLVRKFLNSIYEAKSDKQKLEFIEVTAGLQTITFPEDQFEEIEQGEEMEDRGHMEAFVQQYQEKIGSGKLISVGNFMSKELTKVALGITSFISFNALARRINLTPNPYVSYNSFGCSIYGLPIPHVQLIEVARSGKILKFRATGSVFLANQEGGEDAIKVECLLVGIENLYILLLWALFLYGRGRVKEIELMNIPSLPNTLGGALPTLLMRKIASQTTINPKVQKPTEEFHYTFPFISRHVIIPNTYIETISFEERVESGRNVIKCTILLRTYVKTSKFLKHDVKDNLVISPLYNEVKGLKMNQITEFSANIAWRLANATGFLFDNESWKVGDNIESDDVYYNINIANIASTVVMGAYGMTI